MSRQNESRIFRGRFAGSRDRARLSAQIEQIRAFALARGWFTLRDAREDLERLFAPTLFPEGSISAQLRNLEKPAAGRLRCKKEKRRRAGARGAGSGVWEYRLRATPEIRLALTPELQSEPPRKIRWPATPDELDECGYPLIRAGECRACGERIFWHFTPSGRKIPLTMIAGPRLVPHRAVCKNARQFRAANASHAARANPGPEQASLF